MKAEKDLVSEEVYATIKRSKIERCGMVHSFCWVDSSTRMKVNSSVLSRVSTICDSGWVPYDTVSSESTHPLSQVILTSLTTLDN